MTYFSPQTPWMEFVDFTQIERDLSECRKDWKLHNQFGLNLDKKSQHDSDNNLSGLLLKDY